MDFFGLSICKSLNGKYYAFVIVDNFSRFTKVLFMVSKVDVFYTFKTFYRRVQNKKENTISCIRNDYGREF